MWISTEKAQTTSNVDSIPLVASDADATSRGALRSRPCSVRLLDRLRPHVDARVPAGAEVLDDRDAAAQRAAPEVEHAVVGLQARGAQEPDLEVALELPLRPRADERVPARLRVVVDERRGIGGRRGRARGAIAPSRPAHRHRRAA
jgi:hypothetical protein